MSTKLNGTRYSPAGSRVPTHLLETALRWENFRAALAPVLNMPAEGQDAAVLVKHYERRLAEETDAT